MKTFKAVLVGCGGISGTWLRAIRDIKGVKLTGLVDINIQAARKCQETYKLVDTLVGDDLKWVLKNVKPDIVFNCTIPEAHKVVTLESLRHGCHVLSEKPLADTMANAREMVTAAKKSGRIFAVMQNRRYDKNIHIFKNLIASGKLGKLTTLNSDFYIGAHFGGFRVRMKHPLLLDMAIHTFDAARLISGADPISVYCKEWNPQCSWYNHGASAVAIFEMSGGIIYTYRGSWCAEGQNTEWAADWRAIATKGSAIWNGTSILKAEKVAESKTAQFTSKRKQLSIKTQSKGQLEDHASCIKEFITSVRTGKAPHTICTDNIKSLAMILGAVKSAENGKTVRINTAK